MGNKRSTIAFKETQYSPQLEKKQIHEDGSNVLRNYHLLRRTKDRTGKNKSSKGIANTENSQRSTSISRIRQLLSTVHKKLQPIYDTSHTVDIKKPGIQMGV